MASAILQPNNTLYVKNLDWKVKKNLLKRALYALFTRYGKVLEVVALRKDGLRGQAFVIFEDVQAATAALQALQGFPFFGKDVALEYARETSDRIAKRDGSYVPKARRIKKALDQNETDSSEANKQDNHQAKEESAVAPPEGDMPSPQDTAPPSKYLLAQNLPSDCNEMMLGMLFRQYSGYKEVRMPRPGLAFIEFEDEPHATLARNALNGFKLTTSESLQLGYGKE
ncbi:predicted protein [Phaeodactylum tricornutum CCAP 1055/1]|jgi:RNA recognition motif-containing protein|uniref:RRM domain-containing protein n=2 Tax=Phaeodactylum tricornutum TaxID=2850 RepID=B5Y3T8_PHATC|nr:predicted protein [Phaeodactylum tricornutum CCAP 1055/1]ACI65366.1 predicted protein [Phaeodactylum tricornutum CCAP 1055/1]|eukprot:XP_002185896.1 predicted protein [Phaeodactylum tricornutum CCAP 1055/1]